MSFPFEWNPYADQPHNVAPRSERFRHHMCHAGSYFGLAAANARFAVPILRHFRKIMKGLHRTPVAVGAAFGCAVSPPTDKTGNPAAALAETGATRTLVRVASWERDELPAREAFVRSLRERGFDVCLAVLQRREDVLRPESWRDFLEEVFGRFASLASAFEIGHAWNRTKWGVWNHREYLRLAEPAFELAPRYGAILAGPAVIDFEFHLYPAVLPRLPFDKVTSHLYVDRMGAPENAQCGYNAMKKIGLLKAVVDSTASRGRDLWLTEVNWPLAGTGPYSPASGKPNVNEEEQANYLVRYYVPALASGLVERIYWWQLAAPGYGLIDSRENPWRKRPSFEAFKTLRERIEGSLFLSRESGGGAEVFHFRKEGRAFAVAWTPHGSVERTFDRPVAEIFDRVGRRVPEPARKIVLEESPKYVIFAE